MIKVSDAFNKAFASPTRQVLAKVTMNDVVYTNNDLSSVEYDGGSISGENFNIGSTFSNGLKLTFPKIIDGVKQLDKIKLEFGIVLPDGSSEYVSMGYFFVSAYDPQRNEKRTVIEAFDEMAQLEGSYSSKLTYPAKIQDVALEIANKAGVVINKASFERLSQNKISKIQGLTYRQAIGIIAQFAYGYAIFDRNGQLDIRMLKDPNFSIATADYFSRGLTKNETMYTLNGINCRVSTKGTESNEDYILQSGSDKGNQISLENNVMTQIYLDDIYQHLKTLNYYPFTLSWRGNPAIEAGDWLSMTDITGKVFKIPNLSYRLNFSGGLKATSSANTSSVAITSSEYKGSLHQKVEALEGWRNASGGWSYTQVQEPKNPQEGDVWYKPNGPDTELWVYEGGKWVLKTSTAKNRELEGKLDQAKKETDAALATKDKAIKGLDKKVEAKMTETNNSVSKAQSDATEAKTAAQDAVDKANASVADVQANTQLINDVNAIANNAKSQAQTAATNAQTALTSANTAKDNANKAISDAGKLSEDVLALDTIAKQAKSDADTALINANKGITDAKTALNKAIGVDTRVTMEITNVNNTLATKANSTTVDALSDTVSSQGTAISQNATDIKLKADSTVVNAIKGTVDSQGTLISQNSKDIALKANKSSVDTLTGRVSANETAIDVTSQGVSTLVTKTDNTNTSLSQFKQDYEGFKGTVYSKTQTDTKISTVQSTVDNFKTTVSNTYSSKSETDSKVTAVQANVDKIGNYTAYANSADGTDDFTTVYPNLNLIDGTKDFSGSWGDTYGWTNDGIYKGLTVKKRTNQWGGIHKTFIAPKDGTYTLSAYVKSSGNNANIVRYVSINSIYSQDNIGNNFDWVRNSKTLKLKARDEVFISYNITGSGPDSILWTAGHKWEKGSVATPYMPSEKELTSNDIPKYVGYSVRQSENPKDFSWQPYGGLNSYNIIKATTSIEQNSKDIALKANKSEVDTLSGKVSTAEGAITTMAGQIKLKAKQTDVDTVKGRVTSAEGSISTMAGQIALKAKQADVNTITGKVSSLESSFTIQSGQIKALNIKTDSQTTQIGVLESSYTGFESTISKIQTDVNGKADKTELSQLSQDLSGFKTTVANTYADKVSVASQINQSATAVTSNVQSWTNNKLTAYSTTQQTDSSITNAVASKADKSQITQLSDQITSVVASSGQNNLVYNSTFQDSIDGWRVQNGYKQTTARNIGGNYSIEFKLPENPNGSWNFAISKKVPIGVFKNYAYSVSIMRMVDIPNAGFFAYGVEGYDESGNKLEWKTVNIHSSLSDYVWVLLSDKFTFTNPDVKTVSFVFASNGFGHYLACQPIMVNDKNVGSFIPDGMNKSQITQLVDDINLRVIKGDVVNQINISPKSILIAGNKVQITGETYIENGVINDAKIKTLSANKLTAGTIDAAKINVLNINAANITTGILNAHRIGANSITATHINVANLAAISANLGTITAGTINAATVRIINLDAGAISTGTLNANLIAAHSITADKIKATSIGLFNNDFYTNVQPDGMRMQGKAQIIFGKWKDSSGVVRNSEGVYIGGYNAGVKYVALTRADGSTFMLRANSDMDIGTNKNVMKESLNVYDTTHFWYPQINHSDLTLNGYLAMGGDFQEASIQYDKASATLAFRVPGGRSGSAFWFNQNVNAAGTFNTVSRLSLKNVKGRYQGDALKEICDTNIVEYSYKNNPKVRQLSPIIDDINKIKQFTLPDIINDGKTVNLYAMSSLSWLAIQELAKKLENIEEKIDAIA